MQTGIFIPVLSLELSWSWLGKPSILHSLVVINLIDFRSLLLASILMPATTNNPLVSQWPSVKAVSSHLVVDFVLLSRYDALGFGCPSRITV